MKRQAAILGVAGLALGLSGVPVFAAFVFAYLFGWLSTALLEARRPLSTSVAIVLFLSGLAGAGRFLHAHHDALIHNEQLRHTAAVLEDRRRLTDTPSIAPAMVVTGSPQVFYVHAPGAAEVAVTFGPDGPRVQAANLGHGLHRVVLVPRAHGDPTGPEVLIHTDQITTQRQLTFTARGFRPGDLDSDPARGLAVTVSEPTDELVIIRGAGAPWRVPVEDAPTCAALIPHADQVAVAHRHHAAVLLVPTSTPAETTQLELTTGIIDCAASPSGRWLAAATDTGRLDVVSLGEDARRSTDIDARIDHVVFGPDDDTVVLATAPPGGLEKLVRTPDGWVTAAGRISLGRPVVSLARSPDGRRVVAAITDHRPDDSPGPNHHIEDQLVFVDVDRWRVESRQPTARDADGDGVIDAGASPMGLSPVGEHFLVSFAGTGEVNSTARGDAIVSGLVAPTSVAALREDALIVASAAEGSFTVVTVAGARPVRLAEDDDARRGEAHFHEATRSGIACQSCHLRGGSDGALHDIGHGEARPTLSVAGVGGTAPYLRGASYPTLASLDTFAETILGGYRVEAPRRSAQIARYVASLPPEDHTRRIHADPTTLRRGLDAFVKASCNACHRFPAFTDLGQRPRAMVFPDADETLELLDTPSLIAVGGRTRLLRDGRASSVREVLRPTDDRHGQTGVLDDDEREALARLLEAL